MKLSLTGLREFLIKLLGMKVADTYSLHAEPNLVTTQVPPMDLSIGKLRFSQGLEDLGTSVSKAQHRAWQ